VKKFYVIWHLIRLSLAYDGRNKQALYGIILYAVAVSYALSLVFSGSASTLIGVALIWMVLMFSGLQAAQRSAHLHSENRFFTAAQWSGPREWALAMMLYQMVFQALLSIFTWFMFKLWMGITPANEWIFLGLIALGSSAFAALTTFIAAISSRSQQTLGLMGILSIPILLPILLIGVVGSVAVVSSGTVVVGSYIAALSAMNLVILILGYLLFPYLWNE